MKALIVFIITIIAGIVGMLLDVNIGLDGNFSIVMTLSTLGAFEIYYKYGNEK